MSKVSVRALALVLALLLVAVPVMAQNAAPTVGLSSNDTLGSFLVGPNGMTLYVTARDTLDTSNCVDQCAQAWPPLTVQSASAITVGDGIPGDVGTITRADGSLQVTYNGMPLYTFSKDQAAGDTTGQGFAGFWSVVHPATVYISHTQDLGALLVGYNGFTVYTFDNDTSGVSNCTGQCAQIWPPLTVKAATDLVPGMNLPGKLGTITRDDGSLQVTYNDMPLYFYSQDQARGDTNGDGFKGIWHVVAPETVTVSSSGQLSDFLVATNGMTLYVFAKDAAGVSNCTGQCAQLWPPYTVTANDKLVAGAGVTGTLATITRDDGSLQVTYNGMPLYFYSLDQASGDTLGQGVGGVWSVASVK